MIAHLFAMTHAKETVTRLEDTRSSRTVGSIFTSPLHSRCRYIMIVTCASMYMLRRHLLELLLRRQRLNNYLRTTSQSVLKLHRFGGVWSQNRLRLPFGIFLLSTDRTVVIAMWCQISAASQKSIQATAILRTHSSSVPTVHGGSAFRRITNRINTSAGGNIILLVKTSLTSNSKILSINVLV